jgi:soluble lytic murein transglycosylase-like protein
MVIVLTLLLSTVFPSTVERAFNLLDKHDSAAAAVALDEAAADDLALFNANNLPYLRGRIAENQSDWQRARSEFSHIGSSNPLRPLAAWHQAIAAAHVQDYAAVSQLVAELPSDFPADLKMQIAALSPTDLALKIYGSMTTREARFAHARAADDKAGLWSLIRERKDDDVALETAHVLSHTASSPREKTEVADTFVAHRQFDYAFPLYQEAGRDSAVAAESRYQIARIQFLREDFRTAAETYRQIAKDFAGTDWERDSEYQIAGCYWRLGEYKQAEQAYLHYLTKYGRAADDGTIRNLIDVYRVLGQNQTALTWCDRALLNRKLSLASRQVFIFTKAKILYTQKRYAASAQLFHQLGISKIRSAPGGTTKEEARYFEALSLSKLGRTAASRAIWKDIAAEPFSYYGARSSVQLGGKTAPATQLCRDDSDKILSASRTDLNEIRRPLRSDAEIGNDAVAELIFLHLWDEASLLQDHNSARAQNRTAAELAYVAGRYHRSITYADRLSASDSVVVGLRYPAGFQEIICSEATKYNMDPLWLHAIIWQESKYNPRARSAASARGLMQFIPETANTEAAAIGLKEFSLERLYDPAVNIPMGAHYFAALLAEVKDPLLALAAYNGGLDNARRWKSKSATGDDDLFVADIGFVETKRYVMAVYGARMAYGTLR